MEELLRMLAKAHELDVSYRVTRSGSYYAVDFDFESETISHRHAILLTGNESSPTQVRSEVFWGLVSRLSDSGTQNE